MQIAGGDCEVEAPTQDGERVDLPAVDRGVVAVDVQRPVVGIRLELDVAPMLIIDACVHGQTSVEEAGLLAEFVAPDRVRRVSGWPLATGVAGRCESRPPCSAGRWIDGVAPARTEAVRGGQIGHQIRAECVGQIDFWAGLAWILRDETGTRRRGGPHARPPTTDAR